mmetsp:Transcript_60465/g.148363  ORF Transcript_60465/g.148363 Transcript_60465/m.148363 type:complete len:400 (-) Transcript_60465:182-1381(-)|eukprot:CAMPEP_0113482076 /NCGR_PEP_ID=MMETSP0014_2-20120614/22734_1 /TAXON_ID=2857 /ORGANISM="Nitzschia sp." /LENGTH=399 /DNA_ID=CAMNT_0000375585 /DNA_START=190 /DNA_END=1389 /DNA_ORIENTATION=+ /assembly_acc=CAM_ASM_000159
MRFLLHPTTRTATARTARKLQQQRGVLNRNGRNAPKKFNDSSSSSSSSSSSVGGSTAATTLQSIDIYQNSASSTPPQNQRITKQWGQQCGPCACVLRFEAEVDEDTQRVQSVSYTAKEVMTRLDEESGQLQPVYTTRTNRPMFLEECQCQSLHALAQTVTSYLPSKKIQNVRPDFSSNRSSSAFRHAVLSSHDLPTTNTHCFDVVEDAFTAMIDGVVPSKRPINVNYTKLLKAEMTQRPLVSMIRWSAPSKSSASSSATAKKSASPASSTANKRNTRSSTTPLFPQYQKGRIIRGTRSATRSGSTGSGLGSDRNKVSMSSPRSVSSTLKMFDLNNNGGDHDHYWDEEDYYSYSSPSESSSYPGRRENWSHMDWLSFVDEQYYENGTDSAETATSDQRSA